MRGKAGLGLGVVILIVSAGFVLPRAAGADTISGSGLVVFNGVACAGAGSPGAPCWDVGSDYPTPTGPGYVLIERGGINKPWTDVSPSSVPGSLDAVACGPKFCLAVGGSPSGALVERWDGKRWAALASPAPNGVFDALMCMGQQCVAVGSSRSATQPGTTSLIAVWDEKNQRWDVTPSPNVPGATSTVLVSVSCSSAKSCLAVGNAGTGPVAMGFDGTSWKIVPNPTLTSSRAVYDAVACPKATACFVTGATLSPNGSTKSVWSFDGTSWKVVDQATAPTSQLLAINCVNASNCLAAGGSNGQPLMQRWDGTRWRLIAVPNPPATAGNTPTPSSTTGNTLKAITCVDAADSCLALGSGGTAAPPFVVQLSHDRVKIEGVQIRAIRPTP